MDSDLIAEWFNNNIELTDISQTVSFLNLYDDYITYCESCRHNAYLHLVDFGRELGRMLESHITNKSVKKAGGRKSRSFAGLTLKKNNVKSLYTSVITHSNRQTKKLATASTPISNFDNNACSPRKSFLSEDFSSIFSEGGKISISPESSLNLSESQPKIDSFFEPEENFDYSSKICEALQCEQTDENDMSISKLESSSMAELDSSVSTESADRKAEKDLEEQVSSKGILKFATKISVTELFEADKSKGSKVAKHFPFRKENMEGNEFNFEVFSCHYQNIRTITPQNLPSNFCSFKGILLDFFHDSLNKFGLEREEIWLKCTSITNDHEGQVKSFLSASFSPIVSGTLVSAATKITFAGDIFPQFTVDQSFPKCVFKCEICVHHCNWLLHSKKGKKQPPSYLEGFRQVYEHYVSQGHAAAIKWWQSDIVIANEVEKGKTFITDYVAVSKRLTSVKCHYLWNEEIVKEYQHDKYIRRKQPKTLFSEKKLWQICLKENGHCNCNDYKVWSKLHKSEFKNLCAESNTSFSSLYIPYDAKIIVGGKTYKISGGIKNLEPMCTGKASSSGSHPYTCGNCYKQLRILRNLIKKRENVKLHRDGNRVGKSGFRLSYATSTEASTALAKSIEKKNMLERENLSLRKVILSQRSWETKLYSSCQNNDQEKLIIDLLALFSQPNSMKTLHFEVIKNLVGKLKSGNNHKYTKVIKYLAALHKNRLGTTNYKVLQSAFQLCGKTTAANFESGCNVGITVGYNRKIFDKAECFYEGCPVIDTTDEARVLRFISPVLYKEEVYLVGECWNPNILSWDKAMVKIPRENFDYQDDFSALKAYVDTIVSENKLAKSIGIHNLASLSGALNRPLIYLAWPTPNQGYTAQHLLAIWDKVRHDCFCNEFGKLRENPINLLGHSSDSAGFQLSAATMLMTPNNTMINKGVLYLTLGVGESLFASPYLGALPSTAYLDYDHELRLFLRCLKYSTLDLKFWTGSSTVVASLDHLKELQSICCQRGLNCPFTDADLLFSRYLDQNCDAALKVFSKDIADLLEKNVHGSDGTVLYIRAVTFLMKPFVSPTSNPNEMQSSVSCGISVLRIWRKILSMKKMNLHAGKNASDLPHKRGNFITTGCYKTAELLFTAATNHMLAMFAHFKELGPEECSPHLSGSKTTERIISEIQGKTNQIQCLDAQPTVADVLHRVSKVQFNQIAEEQLTCLGAERQASTNRKRLAQERRKCLQDREYTYPNTFDMFLKEQQASYMTGIEMAKSLFKQYCPDAVTFLKEKKEWSFLEKQSCCIPISNRFCGYLPDSYAREKLNICLSSFAEMPGSNDDKNLSQLESDDEMMPEVINEEEFFSSSEETKSACDKTVKPKKSKWTVSYVLNGVKTNMDIRRALKILIPREYVSRERSRRHIATNFLPGLAPADPSHDLFKYHFVIINLSGKHVTGKIVSLEVENKMVFSASSRQNNCMLRLLLLDRISKNTFKIHSPTMISNWLSAKNFVVDIGLEYDAIHGFFSVSEEHQSILSTLDKDIQIEMDLKLAKQLTKCDIPTDFEEIDHIVDRKLDYSTQEYVFLVKFKCGEEVWLPKCAFYYPVQYNKRLKPTAITQYALHEHKHINENANTHQGGSFTKLLNTFQGVSRKRKKATNQIKNSVKRAKPSTLARRQIAAAKLKKYAMSTESDGDSSDTLCDVIESNAVGLKPNDIAIIVEQQWLNDTIINYCANLLQQRFPEIGSIQDTLLSTGFYGFEPISCKVQFLFDASRNHWVVASLIDENVTVFDSLFDAPSKSLQKQLCQLYKSFITLNNLNIIYADVQKQLDSNDCGVFAVAYAIEIALDNDLEKIVFDQKKMRKHLLECIQNKHLLEFPKKLVKSRTTLNRKKFDIKVICVCKCPSEGVMIQCLKCKNYFHKKCVVNDDESKCENVIKWACSLCSQ